jgi:hypothetical protein
LERIAHDLGIADAVTWHGALTGPRRAEVLGRAWLAVSAAADEVCGCGVVEAAELGVPQAVVEVPGSRDFVRVGTVVAEPPDLRAAVERLLAAAADPVEAADTAERSVSWAGRFTWDRSARLLAAVVTDQVAARGRPRYRRIACPDAVAVLRLPGGSGVAPEALRHTDEIATTADSTQVLLHGCDEAGALRVLARLGVRAGQVRLAHRDDLLLGPVGTARTTDHEKGRS